MIIGLLVTLVISIPFQEKYSNNEMKILESFPCGTNSNYEISSSTLTISGTGRMDDYTTSETAPWYPQRNSIDTIVITEGVPYIVYYLI